MATLQENQYLERADYSWSEDSIRFINTPSVFGRQTFFYVQEAGHFKTHAPYFTERANLKSYLLIFTLAGKGRLKAHGQEFTLLPHSIAYIDCMAHHYYECLKNSQWEFLWLHFYGPAAAGYYTEFFKNGFHIIQASDPFATESTLRRILSRAIKKDLHSEILISKLITDILTQLLIENSTMQLELGPMPALIQNAVKEIEKHFQEELTLDRLADSLFVSKYYLTREFKRYVGTSPNEYLIVTRLNHAKELLKYSALSVEDICSRSGFHYTSYFITQFKKHENCTPLQYRKEWISEKKQRP